MSKEYLVIYLQDNMNNQHELRRLKKNSFLRLKIGHTILGRNIRIFTNYPLDSNKFIRNKYYELDIMNPVTSQNSYDCFDNYAEIKLSLSGAFQFYFTDNKSDKIDDKIGEGYFIVDPRFTFHNPETNRDDHFDLDGLVLQTYLAKNLGYFSNWMSRLSEAVNLNYNMIHFTPLQELGYSRSAYSLRHQLKVNPWFSEPGKPEVTWDMVKSFLKMLYNKYHVLSMADLVYNHTSNDSPWLHEHPECAYNVVNSPHLRPAYLIDRVVFNLNEDIGANKYANRGVSNILVKSSQVDVIHTLLWEEINKLNIQEFYLIHVDDVIRSFASYLSTLNGNLLPEKLKCEDLKIIHGKYQRMKSIVNFEVAAAKFFKTHAHIEAACNDLRHQLNYLNDEKSREIQSHMEKAVENVIANVRYRFINDDGLKLGKVTPDTPIMWFYFYHPKPNVHSLTDCESLMDSGNEKIMAFNGWVMGDDPLRNFAEEGSNVYLRRELIVWGDSVKLRYGKGPSDCPYLWEHMFKYTELTAEMFHAVRLDNCHSTPIHVAQAMLDYARAIRPDIYIVGELFTGNEGLDNIFVNKLGINSLIREAQAAGSSFEQGGLIYRYGGGLPTGSFVQKSPRELVPSTAHALMYDMTHDNQSPVVKRSLFDLIPTAAMTAMACCAIGSTRGYDEAVPHYIDVVNEERMYSTPKEIGFSGIRSAKGVLNSLHRRMAAEYYTELFVDQLNNDVVAITRSSPSRKKSVILIANTAFSYPGHEPTHQHIRSLNLDGKISKILFELKTLRNLKQVDTYTKNPGFINGLSDVYTKVTTEFQSSEDAKSIVVESGSRYGNDILHFKDLPQGSVVAVEVSLSSKHLDNISTIHANLAGEYNIRLRSGSTHQTIVHELMLDEQLSRTSDLGVGPEAVTNIENISLRQHLTTLSLSDLSRLLYRCESEERADTDGKWGTYNIPNYGNLVFCGLQGIMSELDPIRIRNDLGHPLCGNLREGNWLMDYTVDRLRDRSVPLTKLANWISRMFEPVKKLPRFMVPLHFDLVVTGMYESVMEEVYYRFGDRIVFGSSLLRNLATNSIMLCSNIKNVKLPKIPIRPVVDGEPINYEVDRVSLSAGLPHFAEGIWRNWGRDTFIALRGLLLINNRYRDAAQIILTYATVIRHGLVPNLLGDGFIARYNARDATWFWLEAIKQYEICQQKLGAQGESILKHPVFRMYPSDNHNGEINEEETQLLCDVVQEVLQRHADIIRFRERNAGPGIDEHMKEEGFLVESGIRNTTGFPYGGNQWNCGTWMDKMGSSWRAGNKGFPATSRDGSPVEIVGLCASVVKWLIEAHNNGLYPHGGVNMHGKLLTWQKWYNRIKEYFDDMFFIPLNTTENHLKHNRGIYRDCVNSELGFLDYQFRPNFLISMVVAPSLFNAENAWHALGLAENELLGEMGMKTLCERDWAYRGYYDNANDSTDRTVADGFNYHQGPEWLWLTGYYLRAKLIFAKRMAENGHEKVIEETIKHVTKVLARLNFHMHVVKWRSLPELTNKNGEYCHHSCEAQAWSVSTTMEAAYDLLKFNDRKK